MGLVFTASGQSVRLEAPTNGGYLGSFDFELGFVLTFQSLAQRNPDGSLSLVSGAPMTLVKVDELSVKLPAQQTETRFLPEAIVKQKELEVGKELPIKDALIGELRNTIDQLTRGDRTWRDIVADHEMRIDQLIRQRDNWFNGALREDNVGDLDQGPS